MLSDKRRPPAFQEYASDVRSDVAYQVMTNDERAVWHGLRMALWCSDELPVAPPVLARLLAMSEEDLRRGLTTRVLDCFTPVPGHADRIYSKELSMQMQILLERRRERSESGRKGAEARFGDGSASSSANGSALARADARGGEEKSRAEQSNNEDQNRLQEKALPTTDTETTREGASFVVFDPDLEPALSNSARAKKSKPKPDPTPGMVNVQSHAMLRIIRKGEGKR